VPVRVFVVLRHSREQFQIAKSLGEKHKNLETGNTYLTGHLNIYELCDALCKAVTGSKLTVTLEMMGRIAVLVRDHFFLQFRSSDFWAAKYPGTAR
jgi:hypothetical protein